MLKYFYNRPMLISAILCIVLSITAFYSKLLTLIAGIVVSLFIAFLIIYKKVNITVVFMVILMLVSLVFNNARIGKLERKDKAQDRGLAVVSAINYEGEQYSLAELEIIESKSLGKGYKLSVLYKEKKLNIGDIIEADFKISKTDEKYKKSYFSKGIYLTATAENINKTGEKDFILKAVGKTRSYIKDTLFSNMGYSEAATLSALLFGDDSYFTDEFYINVRRSGVSHVMVVSGMHLAVLVTFFLYFTNKIFYNRYFKAISMVAVVLFMIALCGFTMSMLRAGVTYLLMALAIALKRDSTPENTLAAAVTIILIFSPFAILSLGFQLSVLSTFGLLVIALPITNYIRENEIIKSKTLLTIFSMALTSLSATLITLPVLIYYYGEISIVSVITNLLISNAVTLAIWIGVIGVFVNLIFPYFAGFVLYLDQAVIKYINFLINKIGSLSFAVIEVPKITALFVLILILIIFWLLLACKVKRDMLKLEKMREKIKEEGGKVLKWR